MKELQNLLSRQVPSVITERVEMMVPASRVVATAQELHRQGFKATFQTAGPSGAGVVLEEVD